MRPASGSSDDRELRDPEPIGERGDVCDAVHDASSSMAVGAAVAGPVIGDDACARLDVLALVVVAAKA
jgi:hypothetical protein